MEKVDIKSMDITELQELLQELGEPKFRAKQLFDWLHAKQVDSFAEMTNLSKSLREKLGETAAINGVKIVRRLVSQIDGTRKYLFALSDGAIIESVLMKYEHGNTVCISTQVGCRMGCKFCASTLDGVERGLTAGEMLSQIYAIQKDCGERVHGTVLMGSGEPLDNYNNVVKFLHMVTDPAGMGISPRNISLSTCGLVPKIWTFMEDAPHVTLSISLHGVDDESRSRIMPVNRRYGLSQLIPAAKGYADKTGRRVVFEYALIAGQNASKEDAAKLAALLRGVNCHVNLIPLNPVKERGLAGISREKAHQFAGWLTERGISATVRREMGTDIEGACGQLRRRVLAEGKGGSLQ